VAVKILHEAIAHKTEVGGVVLNVDSEDAVRTAISRIVESVSQKRPEISSQHVLIQSMTAGLGEVLLGYRKDPDVGPIVLLASGGVFTEIYRDRSIRLAPVDLQVAKEMISELAVSRIFTGYRGKKPGDLDALAQAIVSLSELAVSDKWEVVDAEVNPLVVRPAGAGVLALDAVVKLA
jgi:acyl-CoA synthetase (NDP forming)